MAPWAFGPLNRVALVWVHILRAVNGQGPGERGRGAELLGLLKLGRKGWLTELILLLTRVLFRALLLNHQLDGLLRVVQIELIVVISAVRFFLDLLKRCFTHFDGPWSLACHISTFYAQNVD